MLDHSYPAVASSFTSVVNVAVASSFTLNASFTLRPATGVGILKEPIFFVASYLPSISTLIVAEGSIFAEIATYFLAIEYSNLTSADVENSASQTPKSLVTFTLPPPEILPPTLSGDFFPELSAPTGSAPSSKSCIRH